MLSVVAWILAINIVYGVLAASQIMPTSSPWFRNTFLLIEILGTVIAWRLGMKRTIINARIDRTRLHHPPPSTLPLFILGFSFILVPIVAWVAAFAVIDSKDLPAFSNAGIIVSVLSTLGAAILVLAISKRSKIRSADVFSHLSIAKQEKDFLWIDHVSRTYLKRLPRWPGLRHAAAVPLPKRAPTASPHRDAPPKDPSSFSISNVPQMSKPDPDS